MDDHFSIAIAARRHDWDACARIMFRQLFYCTIEEQKKITANALLGYGKIWDKKHPELATSSFIGVHKQYEALRKPSKIELPDELDPADAEFANAILEFFEGISENVGPIERTKHFATAIRSSVLAMQINRWIRDFPNQFERWRAGELVSGPTFLQDKAAANDAENAWVHIDFLLSHTRNASTGMQSTEVPMGNIEAAYQEWERSLL